MKQTISIILTTAFLLCLAGCGQSTGQTSSWQTASEYISDGTSQSTSSSQQQNSSAISQNQQSNLNLTEDDALQIALENAGVSAADTPRTKVQRDTENGTPIYDIEFETSYGDYNYEISIETGEIIGADYEVDEDWIGNLNGGPITIDEAKAIVQSKVPGSSLEDIQIWEEQDDGRSRFEGELFYNNSKVEFEMDARTGAIFDWNLDKRN